MTDMTIQRRRRVTGAAAVAAAAAILAMPAGAGAAEWRGVVVDADRAGGTVVTTTRTGEVRTVRTGARTAKRARLGQRLAIDARPLADGTYKAKRVKTRGKTNRAKLRGAVVATRGRQMLVSAGDGVLNVKRVSSRRARGASASDVGAGDLVVADVKLGSRAVHATSVRDVGDASVLEIEGIVLGLSDGVLRVAVARHGEVSIQVPEGSLTAAPAAGDEVEALVSVGPDGSFTLVALNSDDDEDGLDVDEEDGTVEGEGVIAALSAESISVRVGTQTLTCALPAGADLSAFAVGDEVEAECRLVDGALVLRKLESEDVELKVNDDGSVVVEDDRTDDDEADEVDDD